MPFALLIVKFYDQIILVFRVHMTSISAIIITRNAQHYIETCLNSVSWCDEIIVVDSGSADNTVALCRQYTDKIWITSDWPGFGPQKNRALNYAQGEWILSVDADEQLTAELTAQIQNAIRQPQEYTAFKLSRLSRYGQRWIYHSGWRPDHVIRLFKRRCACFSDALVHEQVEVSQGPIGLLTAPLLHYPFDTLEQVLNKLNHYSSASAQMLYAQGQRSSLKKAILHGLWAFVRTYVFKRGFLDGREGFMLAVSNAEGSYYRYLKLMYLYHAHNQHHRDHL